MMVSKLGFGVGFRPAHYQHVLANRPREVDWFEVISENFIATGGRPRRYIRELRQHYPVVLHGVGMSLAGSDPLDLQYLSKLKELADELQPPLVSDHLCWTTHHGHNTHDLLPVLFTEESLRHMTGRVAEAQERLGRRLYLENPSAYASFKASDMAEVEFLTQLCQRTGCGILLDLNNLFVNYSNLGLDPIDYLTRLESWMVGQFHLAGHSLQGEVRIDTHDHPVSEAVWKLYEAAAALWPDVPTLIEWDDKLPSFADLAAECSKARLLHQQTQHSNSSLETWRDQFPKFDLPQPRPHLSGLGSTYTTFHHLITAPELDPVQLSLLADGLPVPAQIGASVYYHAYFLRLKDCLKDTFPALYFICEDEGFSRVVRAFLDACNPSTPSIKDVGRGFSSFLRAGDFTYDFGVASEVLADIAALEWAQTEVFDAADDAEILPVNVLLEISPEQWESVSFKFMGALHLLQAGCDALTVLREVAANAVPDKPEPNPCYYIVYRDADDLVVTDSLPAEEFQALQHMRDGLSFRQACEQSGAVEENFTIYIQYLARWLQMGLIRDLAL